MNHLINLPNTTKYYIDYKGYVYGYWSHQKIKLESFSYIDDLGRLIKINVPAFLKKIIKPSLKDEVNYYNGLYKEKLLRKSTETLLLKLDQVKLQAGKNRHLLTDEEQLIIYRQLGGLEIEKE
jgi:hypothetical protein